MITDEQIKQTYSAGLNRTKVAQQLGISEKRVRKVLRGQFRTREQYQVLINKHNEHLLTEQRLQCILGTLLGDSSLFYNRGIPVLQFSHCKKQYEYAEYKRLIIGAPPLLALVKGKGSYSEGSIYYRMCYNNKACLDKIAELVLINGKKTLNERWLNAIKPEAIAYWFMDDGSSTFINKSYPKVDITFATLGYDLNEVMMLIEKLSSLNIISNKHRHPDGFGYNIRISRRSTNYFMDLVKPYICQSMLYKIKYSTYKIN